MPDLCACGCGREPGPSNGRPRVYFEKACSLRARLDRRIAERAATAKPERRYPLQPLLDVLADRGIRPTHKQLGAVIGLSGSSLRKATDRGLLPASAELYADRAGVHPVSAWPSWFDDYLEDHGRRCESEGCTELFIPRQRNQRFHSKACGQAQRARDYQRRRRATDEAYMEARRAYGREYRATYAEAHRRSVREYQEKHRDRLRVQHREYMRRRRAAQRAAAQEASRAA